MPSPNQKLVLTTLCWDCSSGSAPKVYKNFVAVLSTKISVYFTFLRGLTYVKIDDEDIYALKYTMQV